MKIGTAGEVRRLDEAMILDYGADEALLMENAAAAARDVVQRRWGIAGRNILVVCGTGNNGGDGFALARLLYARGAGVRVLIAGDPGRISGAGESNYRMLQRLPLEISVLDAAPLPALLNRMDFEEFDVIVDAVFGTGLSRNIEGRMAAVVNRINRAGAAGAGVLSLDIPSGIDADSGAVLGTVVRAEATVSFGVPKRGNLLYPGFAFGGRLYLSEISFPPELTGDESIRVSVNIPPPLVFRDPAGHKGSFGKVLIIGGSANYRGAPALAAAGALRSGAGYVRAGIPAALAPGVFGMVPEAVLLPQEGDALGSEHAQALLEQAALSHAVVLGPGLSGAPESVRLARELIREVTVPLVVDGDALGALAGREELTRERTERGAVTVITPHPGEMARLLGSSVSEVEARRIETALEAAERYRAVVVLKGAHTVIAGGEFEGRAGGSGGESGGRGGRGGARGSDGEAGGKGGGRGVGSGRPGEGIGSELGGRDRGGGEAGGEFEGRGELGGRSSGTAGGELGGRVWINLSGNSGLGTAGSGDVLAGVLGALAAAGMSGADAARSGVFLHGLAGDLTAEEMGEASMTAGDIPARLPEALRLYPEEAAENPFRGKILPLL